MSMLSKQCEELRAEAERIGYWSPTASRLMFDAADILWSLRNKNVALLGENDKLRELCATVIDDWMSKVCPTFPFCEYGGEYQDCTDETCGNQIYRQMARELGVEVES